MRVVGARARPTAAPARSDPDRRRGTRDGRLRGRRRCYVVAGGAHARLYGRRGPDAGARIFDDDVLDAAPDRFGRIFAQGLRRAGRRRRGRRRGGGAGAKVGK
jgi:hypothetical protein